jgi:hypothetical protein
MSDLKRKVIKQYKERKAKEKEARKEKTQEKIEENVSLEVLENSDSAPELSDSDNEEESVDLTTLPFLYIDYNDVHIDIAKKYGYKTLLVEKKEGLKSEMMNDIINGKICDLSRYHVIINCWKVLTKSNLNTFSFDCVDYDTKRFSANLEEKYKWGSKLYLKERLTKDERKRFSIFRPGVVEFIKSLHDEGVKIFITSNSHYHFVKSILDHYKLTRYIEVIITPSRCGIPHGKSDHSDSYKDGRQINKERVFVCVERHIGRLCKR